MAKQKKVTLDPSVNTKERDSLLTVADKATRNEKVAWDRKMDNMVSLLAKLKPIEDQILDLMASKQPIMDQVTELRREMVHGCVHPYTHLSINGDVIECKFCSRRFRLANG